jgi:hypothetical protein
MGDVMSAEILQLVFQIGAGCFWVLTLALVSSAQAMASD